MSGDFLRFQLRFITMEKIHFYENFVQINQLVEGIGHYLKSMKNFIWYFYSRLILSLSWEIQNLHFSLQSSLVKIYIYNTYIRIIDKACVSAELDFLTRFSFSLKNSAFLRSVHSRIHAPTNGILIANEIGLSQKPRFLFFYLPSLSLVLLF